MSKSDGSTADYYELPAGCTELQDLISYRDLNAQLGEIFRACYRYGHASHSDKMRDAKKIRFYAEAEVKRLEKLEAAELHAAGLGPRDALGAPLPCNSPVRGIYVDPYDLPPIAASSFTPMPACKEPAASIDDDSARMQAIGQNGNTGEHYEEAPSWDDAPEWAMWMAQDWDGYWCWFRNKPHTDDGRQWIVNDDHYLILNSSGRNESWKNTLQARPTKEA